MSDTQLLKRFIADVFEKASKDSRAKKKWPQANHIADVVFGGKRSSAKTLVRLYNKYCVETDLDSAEPKVDLLNALANYLGFENYVDYCIKTTFKNEETIVDKAQVKIKAEIEHQDNPPKVEEENINPHEQANDFQLRMKIKKRLDEIEQEELARLNASQKKTNEENETTNKSVEDESEHTGSSQSDLIEQQNKTDQYDKKDENETTNKSEEDESINSITEQTDLIDQQNNTSTNKEGTASHLQNSIDKKETEDELIDYVYPINTAVTETEQLAPNSKRRIYLILLLLLLLSIIFYFYYFISKKDSEVCVAWLKDHYEVVDCEYASQHSSIYEGIIHLRKLSDFDDYRNKRKILIDSQTIFFDLSTQKPLVWYYSDYNGYEFFNFSGQHPTNFRELIAVSQDFLNQYFGYSTITEDLPLMAGELELSPAAPDQNETLRDCEIQNTGGVCFVNSTNEYIRIAVRLGSGENKWRDLFISTQEEFYRSDLMAGKYFYDAYWTKNNQFIKSGNFLVSSCDTSFVEFLENFNTEIEDKTVTTCETNRTGDLVIKNNGAHSIRVRIIPNKGESSESKEFNLVTKELKRISDLPVKEYRYTVYSNVTNDLIQQGSFVVKKCEEINLNLDGVQTTNASTNLSTGDSDNCATKKLGDYCFTNLGKSSVNISISDFSPTSPLSRMHLTIDVPPGETRCYYGVPEGPFNVIYYYADNMLGVKNMKIKIVACQSFETVLKP